MEMGAGGVACGTHIGYCLSLGYIVTHADSQRIAVAVKGKVVAAVVDYEVVAISFVGMLFSISFTFFLYYTIK